jgi:RNA polymerase sigma-70 factor (ECF subfamily)
MSALERLSLKNRQVITMQLEGFNYAEIASILGTSEQAVTKRVGRARQVLAQWL